MWKLNSEGSVKDYLGSLGYKKIFILAIALVIAAVICLVGVSDGGDGDGSQVNGEERLEQLCSLVEGVGRCRAVIVYDEDGEIFSVAIVCDGAESTEVRATLTEMITTLYGIGSNRISILKFNE